jgi:hypothetical protein
LSTSASFPGERPRKQSWIGWPSLREAGAGAEMTITAARRQDYGRGFEGVVHQVHITLAGSPTPSVEVICREWALSCAEDRTVEPLEMPG